VNTTIGGGNQILFDTTGIDLAGQSVTGTTITGNRIGRPTLDTTKTSTGISAFQIPDVRIGPSNAIGGVNGAAISTSATRARIGANAIGLTAVHGQPWPNAGPGIDVDGGHADIQTNEIANNGHGVIIEDAGTAYVHDTSIHDNGGPGIEPASAPAAPHLAAVRAPSTKKDRTWVAVTGLTPRSAVLVEVFANPTCTNAQGTTPLLQKTVATSPAGGVIMTLLDDQATDSDHYTATVTDLTAGGRTSAFSNCADQGPSTDTDADGVPDIVEQALLPGTASDPTNAVVPGDASDGDFTLLSATEGHLANVTPADVSAAAPDGVSFPAGLVSFDVTGLTPGASTQVLVTSPSTAAHYWRYGPRVPGAAAASWYEWAYDAKADLGAQGTGAGVWDLHFRDGAAGDDDGVANGAIHDPGGPADTGGSGSRPTHTASPGNGRSTSSGTPSASTPSETTDGTGSVAVTGINVLPLLWLAALLIAAGATALGTGRRTFRPSRRH
jgi:hypothetical protein